MSTAEIISLLALIAQGFLVYYAARTIKENGSASKRRAIVDLIIKQREDLALRRAFELMYEMRQQEDGFVKLFDDQEKMHEILYALDNMEFVAVGIRLGAFDEDVYKELQCSKVRKTWEAASGFVMELRRRKHLPTLYQDLEHLANKWDASPIAELKKNTYRKTN